MRVTMKLNTIEMAKRDRMIYLLIKKHVDIHAIAEKFNLSTSRIRQIYKEQSEKAINGDNDIPEIDTMCRIMGIRDQDRGKLQSILQRYGFSNKDDKWVYTDISIFKSLPNIGKEFCAIIWLAQHMRIE